jgi:hypothetical protein
VTPESVDVRPAPALLRRVWGKEIRAMTLGSRIYLDPSLLGQLSRAGGVLLVHELIHTRQWREFGLFGFLRRYLGDYLKGRLDGKGHRRAYLDVRFEVEARQIAALIEE